MVICTCMSQAEASVMFTQVSASVFHFNEHSLVSIN